MMLILGRGDSFFVSSLTFLIMYISTESLNMALLIGGISKKEDFFLKYCFYVFVQPYNI
jgi:hypothetical protein